MRPFIVFIGKNHGSDGYFLDFSRLIQRIEGNPDCFGTATEYSDLLECQWRFYCLNEPENRIKTENEGGEGEKI